MIFFCTTGFFGSFGFWFSFALSSARLGMAPFRTSFRASSEAMASAIATPSAVELVVVFPFVPVAFVGVVANAFWRLPSTGGFVLDALALAGVPALPRICDSPADRLESGCGGFGPGPPLPSWEVVIWGVLEALV